MATAEWAIHLVDEVRDWIDSLDPWRSSILLVAGDKAGRWNEWYAQAIPLAEHRYEVYLKERTEEEGRTS